MLLRTKNITSRPSTAPSAVLFPRSHFLVVMFTFVLPFCLLVQLLQASPSPSSRVVDGDLLMRNWLFRPYLEVPASEQQQQLMTALSANGGQQNFPLIVADEPAEETNAELWRKRRTPLLRAPNTRRLADQYTPTPCRWKLCASIFSAAFR